MSDIVYIEGREILDSRGNPTVEVDVVAEVGSLDVPVRDVLNLRVGDVVRLPNVRVEDPFRLSVGNKPKFFCQPGIIGKKAAVQILEKIEDITSDDFEELSSEGDELL